MGGIRRGGLFSAFLFHFFELLACKSQFAEKHDKIIVGPAESAQLCYAKLISAVNHVHSQNTKAGLYSCASWFILYIYFCQKWQNVCQPLFFLFLLSVLNCLHFSRLNQYRRNKHAWWIWSPNNLHENLSQHSWGRGEDIKISIPSTVMPDLSPFRLRHRD